MLASFLSHRPDLYRGLLESMTEGVSLSDRVGYIVYTNPAEDALFGYGTGELIGQHVSVQNAYPEEENHRRVQQVIEHLERHGSWEGEWHNRRKDGTEFITASRISAVAVEGHDYWLCVQRDITDTVEARRQSEAATAALRSQEERFKVLANTVPAFVWFGGPDGKIEYLNDRWYDFTGQDRETALGAGWAEAVHPDDVPGTAAAWEAACRAGTSYERELRYRRKDGTYCWFVARAEPLRDNAGEITAWFGTSTDIHDRKVTEERLLKEQRLLETVNETGALIASELNLEKVVQTVTDAGVSLTGAQFGAFFYNVEDPSGEKLMLYTLSGAERSAFDHFGMPRATSVFQPTFKGEGVIRSPDILADERYGRNAPHKGMPKGHLPVRSYLAVPVISRSGEVVGGLFFAHPEPDRFEDRHERLVLGIAGQAATAIDNARLFQAAQRELADRKSAEERLQQLNETLEARVEREVTERLRAEEALRHAQKLDAMGQLTGGVAHDFNNLLSPIVGGLDMLLRRGVGDDRARKTIEAALASADRAKTLVQRLLAFARRQPLQPTAVDVGRTVLGMRDLLSSTLGPRVRLSIDLPEILPPATADVNQLEMALLNLTVNGRDAMPEGGELTIKARAIEACGSNEASLCISVRDTGTGMDLATQQRAIEPFFSTKGIGRGTGLGLSMVHGLVAQLGGRLDIKSAPGEGTTVALYLPLAEEPVATEHRASEHKASGVSGLVLLVDDEELVRSNTAEMLRELGFDVLEASSGEAALALADKHRIDLLVTDHLMPEMIGTDLARALRRKHPATATLIISGYADVQGIPMEFPRLTKPFRQAELAEAIHSVLIPDTADPQIASGSA